MTANGLYALASLDGRPPAPGDRAAMGLDDPRDPALLDNGACLIAARDVRASAVHRRVHAGGIDVLIGDLDEPEELARLVGLAERSDPLTLACAAFERFGDRAPRRMPGSWLLARWKTAGATLDLLMAEQVRDTCYVAVDAGRVAIAPELTYLARLDWVDDDPDPRNLLMMFGTAALRRGIGAGTMLRQVRRVMPGTRVTITAAAVDTSTAEPPFAPEKARSLSFDEALEEIDAILRRIMRQHFARYGDTAFLLSGGLDSSLLGLIGSLERGDHAMTFLTSAAPPGSGIPDETEFSGAVAAHLGLPMREIVPPATADIYRPSGRLFATAAGPMLSPRHYLDETLYRAARALDVGAVIDGMSGEMTVTHYGDFLDPPPRSSPIRRVARGLRERWRGNAGADPWPGAAFHPRLSRQALADMPGDFADLWRRGAAPMPRLGANDPIGVAFGVPKTAIVPSTTTDRALRQISPMLDRRLVHAVASMPAGFTRHQGQQRAIARFLMQGRLPDKIAFRPGTMPYSPNYYVLMRESADAALARIPSHRQAGVDRWIDLEWMSAALTRVRAGQISDQSGMFELQMTAIAAEFLSWWRAQRQKSP